jgi:Carboxypeptidase regulatory-like domain
MFFSKALKNFVLMTAVLLFPLLPALAQQAAGLRGLVTDPTGAVIPGATITLTSASGEKSMATSGADGTYILRGVPAGVYQLSASAAGFASYLRPGIQVSAGATRALDIKLQIEIQQQEVSVSENGGGLDLTPGSNASALVIKGKDLDALSDDPDELSNELQALAGPSAGPNGGQIYVDGFSGGQLPPKSSIREIRVNQNPFSAQYDALGYGRIEILTKPGSDKFHGQVNMNGNSSAFNTTWTPPTFSSQTVPTLAPPDYHSTMVMANLSGPINKKASFFVSYSRRGIADNNLVNATILNPSFEPVSFVQYIPNPRTRLEFSPRVDYQIAANNTLSIRYEYNSNSEQNDGVGQFNLPSTGYNSSLSQNAIQVSDTQIFGAKVVNETRFRWVRAVTTYNPLSTAQTVSVQSAFTGGGSSQGKLNDTQNRYEFQNYTSMALGSHAVKFGVRLRDGIDNNTSYENFNGTYVFTSINTYQITLQGEQAGLTPEQIRAAGGGASQFNQVVGTPTAKVNIFDVGLYAEDDWKYRPNFTLSYGLRFESQSQIANHADWAPRVGLGWGIGKTKTGAPKAIVRAGFGIFYDRFLIANVLQAQRQNGVNQASIGVINPDTFTDTTPIGDSIPAHPMASTGSSGPIPGRYQISPNLHASYTMQTGVSVEKQLSKAATVSMTYLNSQGGDSYLTRDVNAPLPGTFNPNDPSSGVRPNGKTENVYQYESVGKFNQNQLITNMNLRATKGISLFGFYVLNYANSDTAGVNSQPSQPYNIEADYGRASFDVRQRLIMGGNITLPHQFTLSPFIVTSSGSPFNITTATDLVGDLQFNNRPAYAEDLSRPTVVQTKYGTFDTQPLTSERTIPINLETGPARFTFNLRFGKNFGFGPSAKGPASANAAGGQGGQGGPGGGGAFGGVRSGGGGGGGRGGPGGGGFGGPQGAQSSHRYNLAFSVQALNLFNNVDLANPVAVLTAPVSPQFGESNALAGQIFSSSTAIRRVFLQANFTF